MKILCTGAAGFIGSHLVDALLQAGHDVIGIDSLVAGKLNNLHRASLNDHFDFLCADICYIDWSLYDGIEVVYHLAASKKIVSLKSPTLDCKVNAEATLRLLEAARCWPLRHFIHFSTGSVYGDSEMMTETNTCYNPVSHYGVSKLAGERYAMLYHQLYYMPVTVLRPFHVYGERQESREGKGGVIAILCRKIAEGKPFTVFGDGNQTRTFTYVGDVVRAAVSVLDNPLMVGEVFNVSSGVITSLNQILGMLPDIPVEYKPETAGDIRDFTGVSNRKLLDTGFIFRHELGQTLPQVLEWYREQNEA